ncbi:MAG: outer membrane beta-barrel protein [Maribacter sp.]
MSKKNLDKIFQEKFDDFSDIPTEKVWKSIEASLNKKKKNRMAIPFWWKLGGIAAALAIGLYLINPFKDSREITPKITEIEIPNSKNEENKNRNEGFIDAPQVVDSEASINDKNPDAEKRSSGNSKEIKKQDAKQKNTDLNSSVAEKVNNKISVQNQKPKNTTNIVTKAKDQNVEQGNEQKRIFSNAISIEKENDVADKPTDSNTKILDLESTTDTLEKDKNSADTVISDNITKNLEEGVAHNEKEASQELIEKDAKKSIFDEIIAQGKEEEVANNTESKWSAGPSVAPVYFNGMGEGSPVHSIFVPNSKSGDVNLSYGLAVSYEISRKISVKTGIHKVDYGYNTNDVEFSSSFDGVGITQIDNIDYSVSSKNLVVQSKANRSASFAKNDALEIAAQDPSLNGVMAQNFGYIEIPLELNYALLDSKFGIDLIGGISSLFLIDNSVTLSSGDLTTEMGEANNLNNINFSTNIGFGVNYKFSPKIQLNLEPVFKYQLNTFSETSGNFQPFTIGVYSGLNFKF